MSSKVTFLVPVYNGGEFLAACLDCILQQTYANWDAVIVNNNSSDNTAEVIESYCRRDARFCCVTNPETVPVIENHNVAARHIPEDSAYCKVLHVDDWISPDCLAEMVALADAHPEVGVVGGWAEFRDAVECQVAPLNQRVFAGVEIARRALLGEIQPFLSPSVLMIRCSVLESGKQFYELDGLHADIDATYGLLKISDFGSVGSVVVRVGRHESSMTASETAPMKKNMAYNLDLFLRHGPTFLSRTDYRSRLAGVLDNYYAFLARSALKDTPSGFWSFHRSQLDAMGLPLKWFRLAGHCLHFYSTHPRVIGRAVKRWMLRGISK